MTWMVSHTRCFGWGLPASDSVLHVQCMSRAFPLTFRCAGFDVTEITSSTGELLVTLPGHTASAEPALYYRGRVVCARGSQRVCLIAIYVAYMIWYLFIQLGLEGNPLAFHPQYRLIVVHSLSTLLAPLQVSFSFCLSVHSTASVTDV